MIRNPLIRSKGQAMVHPRESKRMVALYAAGGHVKALARAFARDERTVEATLRREGVLLRQDPPIQSDWRQGLTPDALAALQTYFTALETCEQEAWDAIKRTAQAQTAQGFVFENQEVCEELMRAAQPPEPIERLAERLGVDLNRILLAYAEWQEDAEMRQ